MEAGGSLPGLAHNFEARLAQADDSLRRRHGVYYTPPQVAAAMIRAVDQKLRTEFGLQLGLADNSFRPGAKQPLVTILDPACGDGVFLEAAVRQIFENYVEAEQQSAWSADVRKKILPRLFGCELFPEAAADAKRRLVAFFAETGVDNLSVDEVQIRSGDALAEETWAEADFFSVIVGNPPYAAASGNRGTWIRSLMTGGGEPSRNYYAVAGEPLREKKLWLHDDYVKFFRLAQWHLDRSGLGVLAFLTNHGYLDNPTFRGMRWELLRCFDQIQLVDLHGNVKKREKSETTPDDENVFDIEQGVAIGLFTKKTEGERQAAVYRGDVWGTRAAKLERLKQQSLEGIARKKINVLPPHYFFLARNEARTSEYERGLPILELFDRFASAVVTARDKIVIDHDRDALLERIGQFRDDQLSDDEIRGLYFSSSRGSKYLPGDTRSWKLADARASLRTDDQWRERPMRCLYRPFDYRWIYWTPEMIDWPRGEIMRSLAAGESIGLIVRRQMPTGQECNYFGVTDAITLDGVLRSDNRGNESILPLTTAGQSNLQTQLLEVHARRWAGKSTRGSERILPPLRLAALIYSIFHATAYRERYADQLRVEYPRLFFPQKWNLAAKLMGLGERLIDLHLLRGESRGDLLEIGGDVARGYPKYAEGQVLIAKDRPIAEVGLEIWKYRFGVHQVLEKWLKDRRGQELASDDITTYRKIIAAVQGTIEIRRQIDVAIEKSGGWAAAMVDRDGRTLA